MENKKLLKYLLKDLSELEEMFTEKDKFSFDEMEMEYIQNRVSGAKRLVQLFLEHENESTEEIKPDSTSRQKPDLYNGDLRNERVQVKTEERKPVIKVEEKAPVINMIEEKIQEVKIEVKTPGIVIQESITEAKEPEVVVEEEIQKITIEEKVQVVENNIVAPEITNVPGSEIQEKPVEKVQIQAAKSRPVAVQRELQMEDEEAVDNHSKRLGDSFSKEKSVNDLMSDDFSKLEHKLSNRPVDSLHSAIGINDRFQYIRELFEGSVDNFVKTVADLDSMEDIKDAVDYLQTNFKWKKNDTSLKFVNLIKRRFPNE